MTGTDFLIRTLMILDNESLIIFERIRIYALDRTFHGYSYPYNLGRCLNLPSTCSFKLLEVFFLAAPGLTRVFDIAALGLVVLARPGSPLLTTLECT
jgi:hypothetical protein